MLGTLSLDKGLKVRGGLLAQLNDFLHHSLGVVLVRVLTELLGAKLLSFGQFGKPSKHKGIGGMVEEPVLDLSAVLVHWLSDYGKVNERILKIRVILVVSVGEHKELDQVDEFELGLVVESLKQAFEGVLSELNQGALNLLVLLLLRLPFLKEWLVRILEEDSHGSEASALEVEVKVHVVFGLTGVLGRDHLGLGFGKRLFLLLLLLRVGNIFNVGSL